jgi:anaerobic selenocysteine-containing dehydrogenase
VKALVTVASNPVLSCPGGPRLAQALDGLDFMVSLDIYLNETSRHADVILPGLSPLEEFHYDMSFAQLSHRNQARASAPVLPPPAGQVPEWQSLMKLAAIVQGQPADSDVLALDDEWLAKDLQRQAGDNAAAIAAALAPRCGPERLLDLALRMGPHGDGFGRRPEGLTLDKLVAAPVGMDLGPLQPRLPESLRTPSGKIEAAPAVCLADLPNAWAALHEPAPAFSLIGRREVRSNNSWMHNLPLLAKGPERCTLLMHPDDAAQAGLGDGTRARITLDAERQIEVPVQLSTAMMRGVVSLPHGWGHDLPGAQLRVAAVRPGANLNAVLDETLRDPLSGNAVLSGVAVQVTPA